MLRVHLHGVLALHSTPTHLHTTSSLPLNLTPAPPLKLNKPCHVQKTTDPPPALCPPSLPPTSHTQPNIVGGTRPSSLIYDAKHQPHFAADSSRAGPLSSRHPGHGGTPMVPVDAHSPTGTLSHGRLWVAQQVHSITEPNTRRKGSLPLRRSSRGSGASCILRVLSPHLVRINKQPGHC